MSEQIITLAANDQVIENLSNTENQLRDLNNQLSDLLTNGSVSSQASSSFFDLGNIYFWLLLVALVILAFGLLFLLAELQHPEGKPAKQTVNFPAQPEYREPEFKPEPPVEKAKSSKGPVKIKVVKAK